jgi:MGT family glycosyltransferase
MGTAYFFNLPYHGHINPCLPLIQALTRRGERVIFYGPDEFRPATEASGATFRAFNYKEERQGCGLMVLGEWQIRVTEECLGQLVADAHRDAPDYLVVDYACLWGRSLAQHLQLPAVVLHTTTPLPWRYTQAARITIRELRRSAELRRTFMKFLQGDHRLAKRWKLPRIGVPFSLIAPRYGDLRLVLADREMCTNNGEPHPRYIFLGPCVRTSGFSHGEALPPLDDRPLVYVSLGTVWNKRPQFFSTCVDAYRDSDFQVLISHGGGASVAELGPIPSHIHLRTHVDQIDVLRRAAVFLTHGGMNSVCEAALAGVPMLVFPQAVDQFSQANYVRSQGAGIVLTPSDITAEALRQATETVLANPAMRTRSRELGLRLRNNGGAEQAADLITNLSARNTCLFATAGTRPP